MSIRYFNKMLQVNFIQDSNGDLGSVMFFTPNKILTVKGENILSRHSDEWQRFINSDEESTLVLCDNYFGKTSITKLEYDFMFIHTDQRDMMIKFSLDSKVCMHAFNQAIEQVKFYERRKIVQFLKTLKESCNIKGRKFTIYESIIYEKVSNAEIKRIFEMDKRLLLSMIDTIIPQFE